MESTDMTWIKRFKALFTTLILSSGVIFHLIDPPRHTNDDLLQKELFLEIKANFAYFLGNPRPLEKLNEEYPDKSRKNV